MMTTYLNQTCQYEVLDESAGLDTYGNGLYFPAKTVRCRREMRETEIKDKSGKIVLSTFTYFFDATVEPFVGDRIDGRLVLGLEDYVVGVGTLIGWEVYT